MSAGFKYNITPEPSIEERYDVETGRRRRGPYKLDTANLPVGEHLPVFTPIAADLVKRQHRWLFAWRWQRNTNQAQP